MTIEMSVSAESLIVRAPQDRMVSALMKVLGGTWNGEAWVVDRKHEAAVRDYARKVSMRTIPELKIVRNEPATPQAVSDLPAVPAQIGVLFDANIDLRTQVLALGNIASGFDLTTAPPGAIEELAAALDSVSARLWATARK